MSAHEIAAPGSAPAGGENPWGIRATTLLRRQADIRFRVVDGEAVVVRQAAAEVLVLNETASRLLELADGTRPLSALAAALEAEFDVAPEALAEDVVAGAGELVAAGLLEVVG